MQFPLLTNNPEAIFPNLGINFETIERVAFSPFGFPVYWYGIIITIGIALGFLIASRLSKKAVGNDDIIVDFLPYALVCSIIGARTYFVIFTWDNYKNDLIQVFNTRNGGLAIYGAVIGATICAIVYSKVKKINFFQLADFCVPGLILGQVIGRIGNFMNFEAFGEYTDSFFKMQLLKDMVDESNITQMISDNLVVINGLEYIQVHPTFLYESVWNIGVFALLLILTKYKKFDGQIMALYFIAYGIGRFWIEGLRTDQLMLFNTGVASSQALSILLIVSAAIFYVYRNKEIKAETRS